MRHEANLNVTIEGSMKDALNKVQGICDSLESDSEITITGVHLHQGYDMDSPVETAAPTKEQQQPISEEPNDGE